MSSILTLLIYLPKGLGFSNDMFCHHIMKMAYPITNRSIIKREGYCTLRQLCFDPGRIFVKLARCFGHCPLTFDYPNSQTPSLMFCIDLRGERDVSDGEMKITMVVASKNIIFNNNNKIKVANSIVTQTIFIIIHC